MSHSVQSAISIVTMYFDIGRGDWSADGGLQRNNDLYFSYFAHLAKLDNDMVVFTSSDFVKRIRALRGDRPTQFVVLDLEQAYGDCIQRITAIQKDPEFLKHVPADQQRNPEYWSAKYVLINNLKTHFVNQAIEQGLTRHPQVAWVDFGYCRTAEVLAGIKEWRYRFDADYMHFFTIKRTHYLPFIKNPRFPVTMPQTLDAMYQNKVFIIGSIFVGHTRQWAAFLQILKQCQHDLLAKNTIDDDQGVYLMCHTLHPELMKLHFLGKGLWGKANWFGLFQQFHQ